MLKTLVLLLVVANLVFFAWTQGGLDDIVGVRAQGDREPERLGQQVQPERVQILSPQALQAARAASSPGLSTGMSPGMSPSVSAPASAASNPASAPASALAAAAPLACLEAGPFNGAEAAAAEAVLRAALPDGSWVSLKSGRPGLWMVYMGRFKDRDEQLKRQEELRAMRVDYDDLRSPPELVPGMSLGRFEERSNAVNAQERFAARGIRTARVIEMRAPANTVVLRVDKAGPALATQAAALNSTALGKGFVPCARPAGP